MRSWYQWPYIALVAPAVTGFASFKASKHYGTGRSFVPCGSIQRERSRTTSTKLQVKIKAALVGLPNVGKSTLFNAIAQKSIAQAENYPFCTIEPNVTPVPIPDPLLPLIQSVAKSNKAIPSKIELVDVAGLVKGASRGEGLGNRFLATVRECDLIIHVVRNYVDPDMIHVEGKIDPVFDADVVNLELLLADEAHVERRLERGCQNEEEATLEKILKGLKEGIPARSLGLSPDQVFSIKSMGLLSLKPVLYAFNVDEVDFILNRDEQVEQAKTFMSQIELCDAQKDTFCLVSAKLESELGLLSHSERAEYFESVGMDAAATLSGDEQNKYDEMMSYHQLPLMIQKMLALGLIYTGPGVPPERSRTTKTHLIQSTNTQKSVTASGLAGKLHGDIERGFICAEVIPAKDLVKHESFPAAKDKGRVRIEGRDYVVQDGDVVLVKWKG